MELDEMKTLWDGMSKELENQKKLTDKIILDMTQERYNNKLSKISVFETIGAIVCFAMAAFIIFNFGKLEVWYLILCGIFTVFTLLLLPTLSLSAIRRMKKIKVAENNFKESLVEFTKSRQQFLMVQRLGIFLSFGLVFTALPVANKILNNKDIFEINTATYWFIPIAMVFLFFFARWGYGCYKSMTKSAESILKELE